MIHFKNINLSVIMITALSLMLYACSDSTSSDSDAVVVQGSVSNTSGQQLNSPQNVEGTVVSAARINAEGQISKIQGVQTETNASGEFTLEVDVNEASHIAIMAESESGTTYGFLSSRVENGQTYRMKPISVESSAETEIFAQVVASGNADKVTKADIETVVNSQAAASIRGNSSRAAQFAAGLSNAAEARAAFIAEFSSGNAAQIRSAAAEIRSDAHFELEAALNAGASGSAREAAIETFIHASVNAYVMAGMSEASAAKLVHMYQEVFLNSTSSVTAEVRNQARSRTALATSMAIDTAVRAEASASGMSETTVQAIASAGTDLKAAVRASGGASAEVEAAFEAYHAEVRQAMENDSSVNTSIIVAIDTEINAVGGAKTIFDAAISGTVSAQLIVEIYSTFVSSVKATSEAHFNNQTELNAEAMAQLMILINLAS